METHNATNTVANQSSLQAEIDERLRIGNRKVTIQKMEELVRSLGYKFDRRSDCHSISRWMTGPRAGCSYPACSLKPVQIDDGKSAFHFEARRDEMFAELQALRGTIFAVSNHAIVEF